MSMTLFPPDTMRRFARHLLALPLLASPLGAQAYNYPAFQLPLLAEREYNFAAASAGHAGTSLIFQWREASGARWQFGLDGGLAAPEGKGTEARILLGGAVAWQAARSSSDFPFDVAVTAGAGLSAGDGNRVVRLPVGASVGHTFELDQGFRLTPYAHPRLSFDRCDACASGADSKLNVDVDIGASLTVTDQVAVRVAALFGGADYLGATDAVGLSVAWTPKGLRK